MDIDQFGYKLFDEPPSTFAPVESVPVGSDYVLGPGDELRVSLWGKMNAEYAAAIDRDGKVTIPQMGVLQLSGMNFSEANVFLQKELSKYYLPSEVKLNVSMGRLRAIRVFVVGKARRPGSYSISSLSTLINALFASGGPSKSGSMRNIEVKRNGKTVTSFDMYDFLLKGDKTKDVRLMPEDVLFIPPAGPFVGIAGNVKTPAIYELRGETRLEELISLAGGVRATAYLQRMQVERVLENTAKTILDLNLTALGKDGNIVLKDGDLVRVFSIIHLVVNPVELKGNVLRPGTYEWKEGLKVKDIIKSVEELMPDTHLDFAIVERLVGPDYHREYMSFNLGRLMFENDVKENIELRPYDIITVYNKWALMQREKVRISGAVNRPGDFEYRPNMKLSDLVKLAGGTRYFAFMDKAELTRVMPLPEGPKTEKKDVSLVKALTGDPAHDLLLKENDHLFVRAVPEWELYRTVTISGEVKFPGVYTVKKGEPLSSLLERAGGFTDKAYLKGAAFTRESVKALQQRQLDEAIDRLEQEMISQSTESVAAALSAEEAALQQAAAAQRRGLIAKLRAAKAKGRITMNLASLEKLKGTESDLALEEGDGFFVPAVHAEVHVLGSVYNQTAFIYSQDNNVSDYIKKAGGLTKDADDGELYVLKVDGTSISKREAGLLFGRFGSLSLDPGDTIVVPAEIEKVVWLREVKDLTQILFQIAVTAGVMIAAFP